MLAASEPDRLAPEGDEKLAAGAHELHRDRGEPAPGELAPVVAEDSPDHRERRLGGSAGAAPRTPGEDADKGQPGEVEGRRGGEGGREPQGLGDEAARRGTDEEPHPLKTGDRGDHPAPGKRPGTAG